MLENKDAVVYSPKMDYAFKLIFGQDENKDILIAFLNATLQQKEAIIDVVYENTDLDKKHPTDKLSRLDVLATTNTGEIVNIEIQLRNEHNLDKRLLYYWARLYGRQLQESERYTKLKKTICIALIDFNFDRHERYHTQAYIVNDQNEPLMSDFAIHIIDLKKIAEKLNPNDPLSFWGVFLNNPENENLFEKANEQQLQLQKAKETWVKMNNDPDMRYALLMREKQLRDEYNAIEDARDEGEERGIQIGEERGIQIGEERGKQEGIQIGEERGKMEATINTAINLLDILDDETIALKLELPLETVQALRKEQDKK